MKKKILVIEDDDLTAEVLSAFLSLEGFEVHTANSCQQALQLSQEIRQDITISDWRIAPSGCSVDSVEGGHDLLSKIRALLPTMNLILVTGMELDDIQDQLGALNVFKIFIKPVDLERVVDCVRDLVASERSLQGDASQQSREVKSLPSLH